MNKLDTINRWLHILVATLIVWLQDRVQALFKEVALEDSYLLGIFAIATAVMGLTDKVVSAAVNNMRWLRRVIAGPSDIEGDWVSVDIDTADPTRIVGVEYTRIRFSKGQFVMSGETWTPEGKWGQAFMTEASNYNPQSRVFEYYYKQGINRVGGYGRITFLPHDSLPSHQICRYFDEEVGTPHVTRGRRVSMRFPKISYAECRAVALAFVKEFEEEGLLDPHFDARAAKGPH